MDTDAYAGQAIDPRRGDRPFREVADAWRASWIGLEPKTRAGYESILTHHLLPEFGSKRLASITPEAIERHVADLSREGAAPGTVRGIHAALRASLNTAVRLRMIPMNPAVGVKLPRAVKRDMVVLTPEEVTALANHPAITPHYRLLILTAAYTGLRAGELGALRVRDIDLLHNRVTVSRALKDLTGARVPAAERRLTFGPTKTHATRTVSLPKSLVVELGEHIASLPKSDPDALAFTTPAGTPIRHANFYRRHFRPAIEGTPAVPARPAVRGRAATKGQPAVPGAVPAHKLAARFHDLRHSHAAMLIEQGAHPKLLQTRMGHSSITVTLDVYGHLFPSVEEALAQTLDALYTLNGSPTPEPVDLDARRSR